MRYFVRFAYNGTSFHGSQTQPNGITVQETLEQAFSTILRCPVSLTFAGRTDAGVHALEMFAHFDYPQSSLQNLPTSEGSLLPTTYNLLPKLNSLLPPAIAVYDVFQVEDSMHARFSALARTYYYKVTESKDPFNLHLMTQVSPGLDYDLMNEASQLLLGTHDFASFCKVHTDVNNTICTITHAQWKPIHQLTDSPIHQFTITANRFLRNMVRAIVGTLFEVGRHKMSLAEFQSVIDAKDRCSAGQSVSPDGLYLAHITYPNSPIHRFTDSPIHQLNNNLYEQIHHYFQPTHRHRVIDCLWQSSLLPVTHPVRLRPDRSFGRVYYAVYPVAYVPCSHPFYH